MAKTPKTPRRTTLEVRRSRAWLLLWLVVPLALAGAGGWYATHPAPLATTSEIVEVSTPVGIPIYVQVYAATETETRTLHVSDVDIETVGPGAVAIAPLVCKQGSLSITTAPQAFCSDLVPATDVQLTPGDQLVLQITGEGAGDVLLSHARVTFRTGAQWGAQPAGRAVLVSVLPR